VKTTMRVRRRCWIDGVLKIDENTTHTPDDVKQFADRVFRMSKGRPHMIELEFLDEPNPLARHYRFGTDTKMMAQPLPVTKAEWPK
jgi:hypothetical protein